MDLEKIEALHANATPGPWVWDGYGGMVTKDEERIGTGEQDVIWVHKLAGVGCRPEDQAFTAASWEAIGLLTKALRLACDRIADSDQTYEEANTPDGWADVFLARAAT